MLHGCQTLPEVLDLHEGGHQDVVPGPSRRLRLQALCLRLLRPPRRALLGLRQGRAAAAQRAPVGGRGLPDAGRWGRQQVARRFEDERMRGSAPVHHGGAPHLRALLPRRPERRASRAGHPQAGPAPQQHPRPNDDFGAGNRFEVHQGLPQRDVPGYLAPAREAAGRAGEDRADIQAEAGRQDILEGRGHPVHLPAPRHQRQQTNEPLAEVSFRRAPEDRQGLRAHRPGEVGRVRPVEGADDRPPGGRAERRGRRAQHLAPPVHALLRGGLPAAAGEGGRGEHLLRRARLVSGSHVGWPRPRRPSCCGGDVR
mmetsp:Transcript_54872/g.159352  ORF Transcript_54872/g.159352 Transcript_54872/m.159352 type:complete len:312 (+) Transcript_54872:621-1556(+)